MIAGTYEYACVQLIHWIEGMEDGWLAKQAPALREIYAQAKLAQNKATKQSREHEHPAPGSWRNARGVLDTTQETPA